MTQEIKFSCTLRIQKGSLQYQSLPASFVMDQNGVGGPLPGMLLVGVGGVNVNFAPLVQPGIIRIQNLDANLGNNLHWGIWDSDHSRFHPLGMCKPSTSVSPGESFVWRISSQYQREFPATGTGSGESGAALHLRFEHIAGNALIECFND